MSNPSGEPVHLRLSPYYVAFAMALPVVFLVAAYSATTLARVFLGDQAFVHLHEYFHVGREGNLPTYISALYLLGAGLLLSLIAVRESRRRSVHARHWIGLAVGFIYMSFDEATTIHEGIVEPWVEVLIGRGEGIWYFGWTRFYIPIVIIVGLLFIPFLRQLPARYTRLFLLAGAVYLGGAVAVEMVQSYASFYEIQGITSISQLVEETGEMMGVVIFIYALLSYMSERGITLQVSTGYSSD